MSETNNKWVDLGVCKYCEHQTQTNINNAAEGKTITLYGCEKGIRCGKHGVCRCNSYVKMKESKLGKINEKDNVNHPKHYADSCSIECIDAMVMTFGAKGTAEYCVQNAYKYAWRHKYKNRLEDLKKAEWYLDKFDELVTWCETKFSADGAIKTKYLELGQFLRGMIDTERKEYESGKRNK